uniref:Uncharacterized protein n=1 Tax=Chenopodium quinoa TaxID=63459 RepID=A0A803KZK2_CHEQI
MTLLFAFHLPKLDTMIECEYRDMPEPLILPGCVPLHGKDFAESTQNRKDDSYRVVLHHMKQYMRAEGIFVNSFLDLEPGAIHAFQTEDPDWPPFGSGGTLSCEQFNELATGLEGSGHKFLWVVKNPDKKCSLGSTISARKQENQYEFLPKGFVERIKDLGLLVPSWAPQIEILSHKAIGGFLTHCGWNSILESIVHGVPLIAWPLYAEQKMNVVMLTEGLKVALRPNTNKHGLVEAEEIVKVVKDLMEGEEGKIAYNRMKKISDLAKKATSENGDSMKLLGETTLTWRVLDRQSSSNSNKV